MAPTNKKRSTSVIQEKLAGGSGNVAARQSAVQQLRRVVMANLLWENQYYDGAEKVADQIQQLVPLIPAETVAAIAIEARTKQKLRHVPLFIAREMARHPSHRGHVGELLPQILLRPDDATEFLSLYFDGKRQPLAAQVKKGLAAAFAKWDTYQLAKWQESHKEISLKDALFMCRAKARDEFQGIAFANLVNDRFYPEKTKSSGFTVRETYNLEGKPKLEPPDTWEVALSEKGVDKRATWARLITDHRLGAVAFLKNIRNMVEAKVGPTFIREGLKALKPTWLLPIDFLKAYDHAPEFEQELESLLFQCLQGIPKLTGTSIILIDVSGSMMQSLSSAQPYNLVTKKRGATRGSDYTRLDAASMLAVLAREICEQAIIYATAGGASHRTEHVSSSLRGFLLAKSIKHMYYQLGGNGIFTRQALDHLRQREAPPDRIIVISDSQDRDTILKKPSPFGKKNYIIDVSSHVNGINYAGVWTAEISGWSENFLQYIQEFEVL